MNGGVDGEGAGVWVWAGTVAPDGSGVRLHTLQVTVGTDGDIRLRKTAA